MCKVPIQSTGMSCRVWLIIELREKVKNYKRKARDDVIYNRPPIAGRVNHKRMNMGEHGGAWR